MKKIIIFIILLIAGCGYQPFYKNTNLENFNFQKILLNGNQDINERIVKSLSIREDTSNDKLNDLKIESKFVVEETSKDSKNEAQTYRSYLKVILMTLKENQIVKEKIFFEEFSYNKKDNKFELVQYQKEIKNNLINRVIEDIVLFINRR